MILLGQIFLNNLLPVFLIAGAGVALGRTLRPDLRAITRLQFYVLSPALIFSLLARTDLSGAEFGQLAIFMAALTGVLALLAAGAGRLLKADRHKLAALIVAAAFGNTGNFGLAVVQFSLGDAALARAAVIFVLSFVGVYTLGVTVASLGQRSPAEAVKQIARLPALYALVAAYVIQSTGWQLPLPIERAVNLLGDAAIPVMLVVLGLQIAESRTRLRQGMVLVAAAVLLQLIIAPALAFGLARLLGLAGPAWQASILQSAMPAAVITTILAVEFYLDAQLVSDTVLVSTVLCPLTLTPLIAFLQLAG